MSNRSLAWLYAALLGVVVSGTFAATAAAQEAPSLPGGASSLRENHGDWIVTCRIDTQAGKSVKLCVLAQEQADSRTRQRMLALELQPSATGAQGTLVLPFGLALDAGVTLQVDDGTATPVQRFRTCLPAGCIVPITFDAKGLALLRKGTALRIKATADGGKEAPFTVSLKGFPSAFDRAATLAK
jgi:invasion protein IalB